MSDGRPPGRASAGPYGNGVSAAGCRWAYGGENVVRIRCHRHEGIVVANLQPARGLAWLAAAWELAPAHGCALTAPAVLPDLRPGETAAVPLPFALPADGGAMWLTLRVTTAEDEPWAPRGTELCAPRIRLRRDVPARSVAEPEEPRQQGSVLRRHAEATGGGPGAESYGLDALPAYRMAADVHRRSRTLRVP
ncbi:hypothetical protein M878_06975 [Streptomyces roseochromogenus subsp. oscitans DS 12.976]|uniref:Beta-galactosidase domain-containing protein n=1 Tax=Streptomyces roseochromogenus subsp. oscitans DS 12.976 TaxID=1352936 RepID=V6KSW3_STRRC|nr:hypothetical protein M878_06975 [Streptomyces roseochromogenus subsp. oscitans DS 12.976]